MRQRRVINMEDIIMEARKSSVRDDLSTVCNGYKATKLKILEMIDKPTRVFMNEKLLNAVDGNEIELNSSIIFNLESAGDIEGAVEMIM